MSGLAFIFLSTQEEIYIEHLLLHVDAENKEYGLERLCKHYRAKRRLRKVPRFLIILTGLLNDQAASVRRWALNAIALVGTKAQIAPVGQAINANRDDPDIFAAGVAAVGALLNGEEARAFFKSSDIPLEGSALYAAAQQSSNFKRDLKLSKVNIEVADPAELRLVGLLIGLGKAPEHLFSLTHKNNQVIGALNSHDDRLVAQYSVWATYENPKLTLRHLRVPLNDIESFKPNVRKYVYRLIASREKDAIKHLDRIVQGSQDSSTSVREGLAAEIKNLRFDGIDEIVLGWFVDEENESVRHALLEHMAYNSESLPVYRRAVLDSYARANPHSLLRARLEAAVQKTDMYRELKILALDEERDLFDDRSGEKMQTTMSSSRVDSTDTKRLAKEARVLVVTALVKERTAMVAVLDDRPTTVGEPNDPSAYQLGFIADKTAAAKKRAILIATSGMGNQNSSVVTANAIRSYPNIRHILIVGIAGGCPSPEKPNEHVRLGDIVTSSSGGIIDYGNVKETEAGFEFRGTAQRPSASLISVQGILEANATLGDRPWNEYISSARSKLPSSYHRPGGNFDILHVGDKPIEHPVQADRVESQPFVHSGTIGSADILQKNTITRDEVRDKFGVKAMEMEASGVQTAAWMAGHDVFVVRGICDYCDKHKNDDWQNYAATAAAAYARALIEEMPTEWFPD